MIVHDRESCLTRIIQRLISGLVSVAGAPAKGADRAAIDARPGQLARGMIVSAICVMFFVPPPFLVAQEGRQPGASIPTEPLSMPSAQEVDKAVTDATRYTLRHCARDGSFLYQVDAISGRRTREYDILRHAGTMVSLGMVQRFYRNRYTPSALARTSSFLRQYYLRPGAQPGQLAVWTKPSPNDNRTELGATGLSLAGGPFKPRSWA